MSPFQEAGDNQPEDLTPAPSVPIASTISKPKPTDDDSDSTPTDDDTEKKDEKPEQSLTEILKEEQEKSTTFLAHREAQVSQLWWRMLVFHAAAFALSLLPWSMYYEPNINCFSTKGVMDLVSKYHYQTSLSDLMAVTVLRTALTFFTLLTTFSDENRVPLLNSTTYWTTAMALILFTCKAMVISYSTDTTDQSPLSTGQHIYRIAATIVSVFLALAALLLHQWFNPLNIDLFQEDETHQEEFAKRQNLHAQEQADLESQAALLSGPELVAFRVHKERAKRKYEEVERHLKRARMTAKEMAGGATLSELFWLLKPYMWPRGLIPKLAVFLTWLLLIGSKVCSILAPIYIGLAADQLQSHGTLPWQYLAMFCALTSGASVLQQLHSIVYHQVEQQAFCQLSGELMDHLLSLSLSWHHTKTLGKTTQSVTDGLEAGESLSLYVLFTLVPSALEALTIFILFLQTFQQPLISAIIFFHLSLYAITTLQVTLLWKPMHEKAHGSADNQYPDIFTDALQNIEIVKLYNKEKSETNRYTKAIKSFQKSTTATQATLAVMHALQTIIIQSCLFFSLLVVGYEIANGQRNFGALSSMIAFLNNLFAPLSWLGSIFAVLLQAVIDAEAVLAIKRLKPDVVEQDNAVPLTFDERAPLIEFKDLTFHYDPVLKHGVDNVNLTINRGENIAIVGATGSGKSTLTKLLLRFFDPQSGSIHINGRDIRSATNASLKEALVVLPQDTSLFNDTILNNITYSHPDATHDELIKSCTLAGILDFIVSLNLGFHTPVGERGLRLSGGQRQRLCIARSMLKRFRGAQGSSTDVLFQNEKGRLLLPTPTDQPSDINSGLTLTQLELNQGAKDYIGTDSYRKDTKVAKELLGIGRIIVADEASSAVDTITERLIQSAMRVLEEGATTIAITHRLTYVTHFDRIVVMASGRIIEQGTHEQLLNMNGTYALMYAQQFVKESITAISADELATTLDYVKEFTTNPIFSGGGISAASLSNPHSVDITSTVVTAPDADNMIAGGETEALATAKSNKTKQD